MDNLALKLDAITAEKSGVLRLTLTDFRNYQFLRINAELCPIIITGENGCGKTNILEAISFLTPGRGLRSAKLSDIRRITPALVSDEYSPTEISSLNWAVSAQVQNNEDVIEIGTAVEKSARETEDDSIRSFERRIVKINGVKISSQAELGKYISANWLTPQMDRLFRVWFMLLIWNMLREPLILNIYTKNGINLLKTALTIQNGYPVWKKIWRQSVWL